MQARIPEIGSLIGYFEQNRPQWNREKFQNASYSPTLNFNSTQSPSYPGVDRKWGISQLQGSGNSL